MASAADVEAQEQPQPQSRQEPALPWRHLRELLGSEEQQRRFIDSFDIVLCDCDGVLWHTMRDAIPGAAEAIAWLRAHGKRVIFVTNNSIHTTAEHLRKFARCRIPVEEHELLHPAQTVCDYLQARRFEGRILCYASGAFKQLLRDKGFQLASERAYAVGESVQELRDAIYVPETVQAVIMDVDFNMTAAKLMRAHVQLKQSADCLFIGGAADALVPFGKTDIIGSGPFIQLVEKATGREAIILGKPGRALGELLKQRYALLQQQPQRALFIGDSLVSDIQFGRHCGFQTLLILSDGSKLNELKERGIVPDFVADGLADLLELQC